MGVEASVLTQLQPEAGSLLFGELASAILKCANGSGQPGAIGVSVPRSAEDFAQRAAGHLDLCR